MAPSKKSAVYRVTGVPHTATLDNLKDVLSKEFSSEESSITIKATLFPSCYGDRTQTGLIQFEPTLPAFLGGVSDYQLDMGESGLDIDQDFYGLTQLYPTEAGVKIPADIVAVTGLDGHAWGSWRGRGQMGRMWLRDFLSKDLPNCRTMIYGYNTKLKSPGIHTIESYCRSFLDELKKVRKTEHEMQRPIIFIGHSFGGIVVVQSLVMAKKYDLSTDSTGLAFHSIFKATYATVFFGTPHRGFSVDDILGIIDKKTGSGRVALVESIRKDSIHLTIGLDSFLSFATQFKIISLYEQMMTQKPVEVVLGVYRRTGEYTTAVSKEESLLGLPPGVEVKIPVDANHSEIAKFNKPGDPTYTTVLEYLRKFAEDAPSHIAQKFWAQVSTFVSPGTSPSPSTLEYQTYPPYPVVPNTPSQSTLEYRARPAAPNITECKKSDVDLWKVVSSGDCSLVQRLLNEGASPSDTDSEGRTTLHYAAEDGLVEMAKLLLQNGAPNLAKDKKGHTAGDLARMNGYASLALMIKYNNFLV